MNVLLSCVGRRSYMVDYFKSAVGQLGKVICTNSDANTTGMIKADKAYVVPGIHDPAYIERLLEISKLEKVNLIVSLFDIDLPYLAESKDRFLKEGIHIAVSSSEVIDIANDKWKTYLFLTDKGFNTPLTFKSLDEALQALENKALKFPLLIKPRWGMGSLSIFKSDDENELRFFYSYALKEIKNSYLKILSEFEIEQSIIIQEFIQADEFGLDIFNDLEGKYKVTIAKKKLAMRSGETDSAVTVNNQVLLELGQKLSNSLKHIGNLDVDILYNGTIPYILEFNARFGGGYPFSHISGVNFPKALINFINNLEDCSDCYNSKAGVHAFKSIDLITL